jgi:hydrogenase nickel incorporation protein HypB
MEVKVVKDILEANEVIAQENRRLFKEKGLYVLNLMGAPGTGKTTLLERTIERIKDRWKVGVIEGDIATSRDAERIAQYGVSVVQINTGGACHLDGNMVRMGLRELPLEELQVLIVENVGNLVCPAEFNIGEDDKVMILSVTEGEDKPLKYPLMFQVSRLLLLNKIDLLPHVDFNLDRFKEFALRVNPQLEIIPISCKTGQGLDEWIKWLENRLKERS